MNCLIVIAIILIIAAIAVLPKMNKQIMAAHEMAAIRMIGTIHQGETQYYSQFGKYAQNLSELGPPASGAAGPASAEYYSEKPGRRQSQRIHLHGGGFADGIFRDRGAGKAFGNSGGRTFSPTRRW